MKGTPNELLGRLLRSLQPGQRSALSQATKLAERKRLDLYLAGGALRDLLLGGAQIDLDLVLEGDAIAFAEALAGRLEARLTAHPRFGTASLQGDGFHLDLAQARAEDYERPGALPTTRPARLEGDLARRDFTVNAMALQLTGRNAGRLVDPHGGRADLEARSIRVLHAHSFQDDATRILRALRYEGRLGFRLDSQTEVWLRRDLSYLDTISGARLRRELERIAGEDAAGRILARGQLLGALAAAHPALRYGDATRAAIERLGDSHRPEIELGLLLVDASDSETEAAIARLSLTGRQAATVRGLRAVVALEGRLKSPGLRPSEAVRLLEPHPPSAIEAFALMRAGTTAGERARRHLDEWRTLRARLDGRALTELGIAPGPEMGELLRQLRDARLDGLAATREDELRLVERAQRRSGLAAAGASGSHG